MHSRQSRDAEYDAKLAEVPLRTEPIGLDRYHRKYWAFKGQEALMEQPDVAKQGGIKIL